MVKRKKFKRSIVSLLAITLLLLTLISPFRNFAHAATTSADGNYEYNVLEDGTIRITKYLGSSKDVTIPATIDGKKVTKIGDALPFGYYVFQGKSLKSVKIPDSVTEIGRYAFNQNQLTSVKLPKNLRTIGVAAFYENYLQEIVIPNKVTMIDDMAFTNNALTSVTLSNSVETIGEEAFRQNYLTSVIIPNSVISIDAKAFGDNPITKFIVNNMGVQYYHSHWSSDYASANGTDPLGGNESITIYGYTNSSSKTYANSDHSYTYPFVELTGNLKNAIVAVENAETTKDLTDIATAQGLVNQLDDGNEKDVLQNLIGIATSAIDDQKLDDATAAVEQAESSKNANDVIAAQGLVNALEDGTDKTNLQTRLDAVQDAINKQQAENDATTAVEQAESSHSQADVDHANDLVNALPDGTVKADLLDRIDTVQTTIDEAGQGDQQAEDDATAAVEQAESSHSQTDVDHARELVNALPDGTVKDDLLNRLDAVQTAIDGDNEDETEPGSTTATNDVDFTLEGGELSLANSEVVSFGTIKLSEQAKSYSTSFTDHFTVKDLTGNQLGYRVDVSATPFTDGKNTLPKGTLSLNPVSAIERVGTGTSAAPVSSLSANQIIDNGKVTLVSAATGTGMGVYNLTFPENALSIAVDPTTAKIDGASSTYQSTITWDLIQAP